MKHIALVGALAASIVLAAPARAEMPGLKREVVAVAATGAPNLWRVAPGLYRSAQPDAQGFAATRRLGVRTVVNLRNDTTDVQFGARGLNLVDEKLDAADLAAGEEQIVGALRTIRRARRHGGVLVHCEYGADRTGAIIALYRMIYQNWSRSRAITEMIDGPFGFHNVFIFAPPGRSIRDYLANVDLARLRRKIGD